MLVSFPLTLNAYIQKTPDSYLLSTFRSIGFYFTFSLLGESLFEFAKLDKNFFYLSSITVRFLHNSHFQTLSEFKLNLHGLVWYDIFSPYSPFFPTYTTLKAYYFHGKCSDALHSLVLQVQPIAALLYTQGWIAYTL